MLVSEPFAFAVIGGLIVGTFLTLLADSDLHGYRSELCAR